MAKCSRCKKGGFGLKLSSAGLCMDCLVAAIKEEENRHRQTKEELAAAQARITPEFQSAESVTALLAERKAALEKVQKEYDALVQEVEGLKAERIVQAEAIELESFSLYTPRFAFATSAEYKKELDSIRERQKEMIKDKEATITPDGWTLNGSKAAGAKLISETSKLFLRSFNNECDMAVADAKFSNFERCIARIDKSFETINKLGSTNQISISFAYRKLKQEELALAYEYQCKLQEEKEAARALREQQREEAKVAREIEAARKEAEKEKKHYIQALQKLKAQADACADEQERAAIIEKQNDIISNLDELTQKMEDIDYRQSNQRAGYVYIISNIGSFGPDVYKIGMTRRLDPYERVYELGDASVPFMFDVHAMIFTDDAPALETALHHAFADRRINMVNNRREYFRVSLDEIKAVVYKNHDKTVEFKDVPDAQQYRESLLMCKNN